ncbi:hypothetical protein H2202_009315 [Exophiala xenobiotica]|nr:hypothetical protein H2202_009315 [Exophiala xenobiotica]KAK5210756.1 hypothetical protein LTR41_003368 [Exophiala xenobiotica]KAK5237210.1 hypothetical protein LTR47_001476 [Exophiala xenobiotica]KAK5248755.1 hypothetical protein LTS06_006309 [Exophiala xenobiotica]KAK5261889.1 hypothetical protein LTR40_001410 [Exophiala xenobiotica]
MDPHDEGSRRSRGIPKGVFQWAGRKVNEWLESDSDQSSSSRPSHHQTAHQPAECHGQIPISPAESDRLRLLFKATPLPCPDPNASTETNTTSHAVLAPVNSTSCTPYPPAVNIVCVDFLGDVHSATTYVKRDLGFQGQLGSYILLSYGDTMYSDANYSDTWRGMTSDSLALATHNPLVVVDPVLNEQGYPPQFCPLISDYGEDPADCALGITNVVQTSGSGSGANESYEGVMFFLLNHRPNGTNNLVGAGVASVSLDTSSYPPVPQVRRLAKYWWDANLEPWYGDICALRHQGYVYAYGHGGQTSQNPWVYVARARVDETTVLEAYEYWNGDGWQSERLMTAQLGEKESVFWQINQGQVVWSAWLGCFVFVYCDNWMNNKVLMKTAQKPEGPWSETPVELYQATQVTEDGAIYAAVPHDYFDKTGRTLVVTFTNHPNRVQAVMVTFG